MKSANLLRILAPGSFAWCSVFSEDCLKGNPTFVIRLSSWGDVRQLAAVAQCLGNHETTFFTLNDGILQIRWFAADKEVPLCGHGALAVASILESVLNDGNALPVLNHENKLWLLKQSGNPFIVLRRPLLIQISTEQFRVGAPVVEAFDVGRDYLLILKDEESLRRFRPIPGALESLDKIGCILSAPSSSGTAAFRFFAPRAGITEDRASGSVIPSLVEYWKQKGRAAPYTFYQESGYSIRIKAEENDRGIAVGGDVIILGVGGLASSIWSART